MGARYVFGGVREKGGSRLTDEVGRWIFISLSKLKRSHSDLRALKMLVLELFDRSESFLFSPRALWAVQDDVVKMPLSFLTAKTALAKPTFIFLTPKNDVGKSLFIFLTAKTALAN